MLWTAPSDFESNRGVPFLYDVLASNFLAAAGLNDSGLAAKLALVTNGDGAKVFPRADLNKGFCYISYAPVADTAAAAANTATNELAYARFGPASTNAGERCGSPFLGRRLQCDLRHLVPAVEAAVDVELFTAIQPLLVIKFRSGDVVEKRQQFVRAVCDAAAASTYEAITKEAYKKATTTGAKRAGAAAACPGAPKKPAGPKICTVTPENIPVVAAMNAASALVVADPGAASMMMHSAACFRTVAPAEATRLLSTRRTDLTPNSKGIRASAYGGRVPEGTSGGVQRKQVCGCGEDVGRERARAARGPDDPDPGPATLGLRHAAHPHRFRRSVRCENQQTQRPKTQDKKKAREKRPVWRCSLACAPRFGVGAGGGSSQWLYMGYSY